jgi:hypothetical protein
VNLEHLLAQCELFAATPIVELPQWVVVVGAAVALTTFAIAAWRLTGKLTRIKHGDLIVDFRPPSDSDPTL